MIDKQLIMILVVLIESVGILLAEKKAAFILTLATLGTVIIFFLT